MSFYFPSQTRVIIDIVLYKRVVFVRFIYIKENNNSIGDAMYREKTLLNLYIKIQTCNDQRERKEEQLFFVVLFPHYSQTKNIGRQSRSSK